MQTESPIITKIRKLLAHATSAEQIGSAEEAAAFFAQAQALATRNQIELASVEVTATEPEDPMVRETLKESGKRMPGWKKVLVCGVCHPLGVFVVNMRGAGAFSLAGRSRDVQTATYLYRAICAEIERLARRYAQGQGAAYTNAFKLGASQTISRRLREQHETTMAEARASGASETALVRVEQSLATAETYYRSTMSEGLRLTASRVQHSANDGLVAGRKAGEGINIGGNAAIGRGNLALGRGRD